MKVSIEVGKGWCASMVVCKTCGCDFLLIRQRNAKISVRCPDCEQKSYYDNLETPWVGLIEDVRV